MQHYWYNCYIISTLSNTNVTNCWYCCDYDDYNNCYHFVLLKAQTISSGEPRLWYCHVIKNGNWSLKKSLGSKVSQFKHATGFLGGQKCHHRNKMVQKRIRPNVPGVLVAPPAVPLCFTRWPSTLEALMKPFNFDFLYPFFSFIILTICILSYLFTEHTLSVFISFILAFRFILFCFPLPVFWLILVYTFS